MPYGFNDDKSKFDLDDLIGSVATIETSPATTNHAKGEYIVYDSQLYEVTAAIASGEALVVGTNISATTTGTELTELKNGLTVQRIPLTFNSALTEHVAYAYRMGNIVTFNGRFTSNTTGTSLELMSGLPFPGYDVRTPGALEDSVNASGSYFSLKIVKDNGVTKNYFQIGEAGRRFVINATYIIAE